MLSKSQHKQIKIPFGIVQITTAAKKNIKDILTSNKVTSGKYVKELEDKFSRLIGIKDAVSVSSGTDAITLALAALRDFGARYGDEIIVPALSFISTGAAVLHAGFRPVFVDIKRETLNIDPSKIENAITSKTRAIMPVHLMGKPAEMDKIKKITSRYKLFLIEDACEAYGTKYKNKTAGTFGDMACFSLYAAHVITSGEGGMIVTDKPKYAEILRSLRTHGRACKCKICVLNTSSAYCKKRFKHNTDIRFVFERIGYSSKMNELEAAIALGQIDKYNDILAKRRKNLLYLTKKFEQFEPFLTTLKEEPDEKIGPHAFAVIVQKISKINRDRLVYYLGKKGIDSRLLFSSMPTQCAGFKFLGYKLGDFPNAEYVGKNGFHIGIHQGLNRSHLDYFIKTVKDYLSMHKNLR